MLKRFNIKNPRALLAFSLIGGLAVVALGVYFLAPYQTQHALKLESHAYLNLPCQSASVKNSTSTMTMAVVDVKGHGFGHTGLVQENDEVRFFSAGIFRGLKCHVSVSVNRGDVVYLPDGMAFVARGVLTPPNPQTREGSPLEWRRFEGLQ